MNITELLFWISVFLVFYAFLGYGLVLYLLVRVKRMFRKKAGDEDHNGDNLPEVTLFVSAYNEREIIPWKVKNSLELDYPRDKIRHVWVTDGSDDGSAELLRSMKNIEVYHQPERRGKIAAMNRGMQFVRTPIVIFSDANTRLGKESVRRIVSLFKDPGVGAVSGEKRISATKDAPVSGAGEGIYWKYESQLKKWDSELYSVVGAAGELFAIRSELWKEVEPDTLLDDFIISLRIAMAGYTVKYDPEAYAEETGSASMEEELKRKIRISAGGIQAVLRLKTLLNIFKYGILSFQYISHRVLRWMVTPYLLLLIIPLNLLLCMQEQSGGIAGLYTVLWYAQILFYLLVLTGWLLRNRPVRFRLLLIPYYFWMMNYSVYIGLIRYVRGRQSVVWEKVRRTEA
ncbi:MAG: glycosyltransferase family 2 protein [Mangrovibacterium sp.]